MAFTYNPQLAETPSGVVPDIAWGLHEADSMSFLKGEPVYLNVSATAPNLVTNVATDRQTIYGFALVDATNVTSDNIEIPLLKVDPRFIYKIRTTNAGTAATCESFVRGKAYDLYVASNIAYADLDTPGATALVFEDFCYDKDGDYDYWGLFRFIYSVCQPWCGA